MTTIDPILETKVNELRKMEITTLDVAGAQRVYGPPLAGTRVAA